MIAFLQIFVLIPGQALRLAFGDNGAGFLEQALHIGRPGIVIGVDDEGVFSCLQSFLFNRLAARANPQGCACGSVNAKNDKNFASPVAVNHAGTERYGKHWVLHIKITSWSLLS